MRDIHDLDIKVGPKNNRRPSVFEAPKVQHCALRPKTIYIQVMKPYQ
jgi:hypothetical protein